MMGDKKSPILLPKMISKEQITELVLQKLEGTSFFPVDVKVKPGNKIEVYVDGDNGIGIKDCVAISRHIEANLNRDVEDYSLEVSSPDATKPLTMVRQYHKHIGKEIEIALVDGTTLNGRLTGMEDETNIVIESIVREKKVIGKGKTNVIKQHQIPLSNIKAAKIKLKF